jgi:hypothetical protein
VVSQYALLDAMAAVCLPEAQQDAVAEALGDVAVIPLPNVKGLLMGVGVGLAAAKRVVGRLVRAA